MRDQNMISAIYVHFKREMEPQFLLACTMEIKNRDTSINKQFEPKMA